MPETEEQVWLVKLYGICPASSLYLGDEEWADCQHEAKRFSSKVAARKAARAVRTGGFDGIMLVRLRPRSEKRA